MNISFFGVNLLYFCNMISISDRVNCTIENIKAFDKSNVNGIWLSSVDFFVDNCSMVEIKEVMSKLPYSRIDFYNDSVVKFKIMDHYNLVFICSDKD